MYTLSNMDWRCRNSVVLLILHTWHLLHFWVEQKTRLWKTPWSFIELSRVVQCYFVCASPISPAGGGGALHHIHHKMATPDRGMCSHHLRDLSNPTPLFLFDLFPSLFLISSCCFQSRLTCFHASAFFGENWLDFNINLNIAVVVNSSWGGGHLNCNLTQISSCTSTEKHHPLSVRAIRVPLYISSSGTPSPAPF